MTLPERLDTEACKVHRDALPGDWGTEMGRWLYSRRASMTQWPLSATGYRWLNMLPEDAPGMHLLRAKVTEAGRDMGFDPQGASWSVYAMAAHHHGSAPWFRMSDHHPDARVAFSLTMHTPEKLFDGGEIEFWSGLQVPPDHMTLAVWNPTYSFRIRTVECWAASIAFGRWSIEGVLS